MIVHRGSRALGIVALMLATATSLCAAVTVRPAVPKGHTKLLDGVGSIELPRLELDVIDAQDRAREAAGEPWRFAIPHEVFVTPWTHGTWNRLGEDTLLWRARITTPEAPHLNFGFSRYFMPPGGRLLIYSADETEAMRSFSAADNRPHGELWTPVILSNDVVLDLVLPEAELGQLDLALTSINQGYRGFGVPTLDKSASCNVDVACPEGDGYRDIIRSVARISVSGAILCSGAMVNNTERDRRPLFLTANHCVAGPAAAPRVVVYWRYENSTCRPPGSSASAAPGDGTLSRSQSGSTMRATLTATDFTLLELDAPPQDAWRVFWAGWNRGSGAPARAVSIHHPQGDEKRISLENDPLSVTSYSGSASPGDGTHLRVADWDVGTTEGGSSGGPLFDQNKRVVGQLHGGNAACNNDDPDWYGHLHSSWSGGGSSSTRLSDWLDPASTGQTQIDGMNYDDQPTQPKPAAPSNLTAVALSAHEVQLTWQDNSDNESSFRIEMDDGSGFLEIGTVPADTTSAVIAGLVPETQYSFRVRARGAGGSSAYSNVATATTESLLVPPPAPTGLTAETMGPGQIALVWDDRSDNEEEFVVERRAVARWVDEVEEEAESPVKGWAFIDSEFEEVALVAADMESLLLVGLEADTTYNFRVRARNAAGSSEATGEAAATTASVEPPPACVEGPGALCLLGGRFRVGAFWKNQHAGGVTGVGTAVAQSDKTGFFWFFDAANIELVVKMLDGTRRPMPAFWLFYGALSEVEYWLISTDIETGAVKTYYNEPGNLCGRGDTRAFPVEPPELAASWGESAEALWGGRIVTAPGLEAVVEKGEATCTPGPETLCLLNRFAVTVDWTNQHAGGTTGEGRAVEASGSENTGYFWFFDSANIELAIKVLDGTKRTGYFWVFYGALSDVEYDITVTDTVTQNQVVYHNPPGNLCGQGDTRALPGP